MLHVPLYKSTLVTILGINMRCALLLCNFSVDWTLCPASYAQLCARANFLQTLQSRAATAPAASLMWLAPHDHHKHSDPQIPGSPGYSL